MAQEIKTDKRQVLFAATQLLEAKEILFSFAFAEEVGYQVGYEKEGMQIDLIDVSRGSLHSDDIKRVFLK